jgi:hypothetical protein
MRISLSMGAGRVCAAATLFLLLGALPALSHATSSGPGLRVGAVQGHAPWAGSRGWSRNGWAWRGQNGWNRSIRWNGWPRNAWRWNGWGRNHWYWSQAGLFGFGYGPAPDAYANAPPPGAAGQLIVIGAPSISVYPQPEPASFDQGIGGGCVIHKLNYDSDGKYVGEQQTPEC